MVEALAGVYLAGVAVALWRTDAHWPVRLALALVWPLGPLAFAVTLATLLTASLIAFPVIAVPAALAGAAAWWMWG